MENQHRKITGYSELNEDEIRFMNAVKAHGAAFELLVNELRGYAALDQRWISIGVTQIQQGLMAVTRGIARPTSF